MPDIAETGAIINASPSDVRALMILLAFVFVVFAVLVLWREILNWKLAKSLDKMSDALLALRIVIVESVAEGRGRALYQDHRQDMQDVRQDRQDVRQDRQDEKP